MGHTTTQIIAKEGWKYLITFGVLFLLAKLFDIDFLEFLFFILFLFSAYVYRNPERIAEEDDEFAIVAPADGKIKKIEKIHEDKYINKQMLLVSIESSVLDASITRMPTSGKIKKTAKKHGLFLPLSSLKAPLLNERASMVCETPMGEILITQIAGIFSPSIDIFKTIGSFKSASRWGVMIDGETRLLLPLESRIKVSIGDSVKSGESILGYFNESKS